MILAIEIQKSTHQPPKSKSIGLLLAVNGICCWITAFVLYQTRVYYTIGTCRTYCSGEVKCSLQNDDEQSDGLEFDGCPGGESCSLLYTATQLNLCALIILWIWPLIYTNKFSKVPYAIYVLFGLLEIVMAILLKISLQIDNITLIIQLQVGVLCILHVFIMYRFFNKPQSKEPTPTSIELSPTKMYE